MTEESARHIVDEPPHERGSYLTVRQGDRVYDLYGWAAGRVVELRIAATRDQHFDGIVMDFRGARVFVDAPEVSAFYPGALVLGVTVSDLTRAARDPGTRRSWPGGPSQVPPRDPTERARPDDAVALMGAVSRMYVAGRVSLEAMERDVERVLEARSGADLDAIAADLHLTPVG